MNPATANPMDELIRLVTDTRYEDLPAQAIDRAKAFLLDTVGVGIAGNRAPLSADVLQAALGWGASADASVLGSELRLPAPSAALVNGYRIHSQEFDCVFEPGVIIPLGPLVAAILAHVERRIARGESVTGRALILALVVGVEISCTLGLAAKSAMKFFRPGTTGGFSALAALCVIDGADSDFVRRGFGIVYSQISGSMQSHEEGSSMLAMQIGFNARAALTAFDLASAGLSGPQRILDGRFGYFPVFESEGDIAAAWAQIAKPWKITRLSHKPYPRALPEWPRHARHGTRHAHTARRVDGRRHRARACGHAAAGFSPGGQADQGRDDAQLCKAMRALRGCGRPDTRRDRARRLSSRGCRCRGRIRAGVTL